MRHGPSRCIGAEEAYASSDCSVLTLYVSDGVILDWPPQDVPSRVFFVVKEVGSRGRRVGPEAPEPLEAKGKLCILVSCPVCDPVGGAVGRAMPREWREGAPEHWWLGACLLAPGPWLASLARQEPRAGPGCAVDREPRARASPRAPGGGHGQVKLGQVSLLEGACEPARWA